MIVIRFDMILYILRATWFVIEVEIVSLVKFERCILNRSSSNIVGRYNGRKHQIDSVCYFSKDLVDLTIVTENRA